MKTIVFKLGVFERINLPTTFPESANYERGIVIRDLRKKLELTQEELKDLEFKSFALPDGRSSLRWDPKKDKPKEFPFTQLELEVVQFGLKHMEKSEKLPTEERWLSMYDLFMKAEITDDKPKAKK